MGKSFQFSDFAKHQKRLKTKNTFRFSVLFGSLCFIGILVSIFLLFFASEKVRGIYAYSWLWAFAYFLSLSLGGCFLVLLHHSTGSGWGTIARRLMENLAILFPCLFFFSLPFLFPQVQQYLWEWMNVHRDLLPNSSNLSSSLKASHDPHTLLLASKYWYLNLPFWYSRFFFYFFSLGFVIYILRRLSIRQDSLIDSTTKSLFLSRKISYFGLLIFGVVVTFLAIDWFQGLDFTWFSTMWGVYFFAGCVLGSLALLILLFRLLCFLGYLKPFFNEEHHHLLGKLLFAFVMFWSYIAFSQYFLIWYANLTEETRFFLLRSVGEWNLILWVLVFGHFAFPFLFLLSMWVKKNAKAMVFISIYLLFMHAVDLYFIIIPERDPSLSLFLGKEAVPFIPHSLGYDLFAFFTIGFGFCFCLLKAISTCDLYPSKDPRILESINVTN